jgi:predicted O-methyltransferase YrrM
MTENTGSHTGIWPSLGVGTLVGALGAAAVWFAARFGLTSPDAAVPTGVILALVTALAHYWKTRLTHIMNEQHRQMRRRFGDLEQHVLETRGLVQLGNVGLPYPLPFGGDYALTGDAAAVLVRQVALLRPRVVVECGSGVSTVLVAKLLKDHGGSRIYSLDHDPEWAAVTRKFLSAAGLDDHAVVLDAPLVPQIIDGREFRWYRLPAVIDRLEHIDLLIVDGPPQSTDAGGLPRYPALPRFVDKLSPTAEIFVDDAVRPQEQEMVRQWTTHFPEWQALHLPTVPGTCLLSRAVVHRQPDAGADTAAPLPGQKAPA